jgi:dTDP-glucose pyrophosphorylase
MSCQREARPGRVGRANPAALLERGRADIRGDPMQIACIEEIAYRSGFIDAAQLRELAAALPNTSYGRYLETVSQEPPQQF